jgi:hypothetical protein
LDEQKILEKALDSHVGNLFGEYAWVMVIAFVALLFKSTIESTVAGFLVFIGNDYNDDDVVLLDGRPARIIRSGWWSTIFYIYDVEAIEEDGKEKKIVVGGKKVVIDNTKLKDMLIEKPLSKIELK